MRQNPVPFVVFMEIAISVIGPCLLSHAEIRLPWLAKPASQDVKVPDAHPTPFPKSLVGALHFLSHRLFSESRIKSGVWTAVQMLAGE